jgi:hypothetical protein
MEIDMALNRQQRRALQVEQHTFIKEQKLPNRLTLLPANEKRQGPNDPVMVWQSSKYLVQIYEEYTSDYPELKRLSICRVRLGKGGRWQDGLSWDELQTIKRDVGYGDWWACEIYPRDKDVVNVANMRHLWVMPEPLPMGWVNHA